MATWEITLTSVSDIAFVTEVVLTVESEDRDNAIRNAQYVMASSSRWNVTNAVCVSTLGVPLTKGKD